MLEPGLRLSRPSRPQSWLKGLGRAGRSTRCLLFILDLVHTHPAWCPRLPEGARYSRPPVPENSFHRGTGPRINRKPNRKVVQGKWKGQGKGFPRLVIVMNVFADSQKWSSDVKSPLPCIGLT